MFWKSSISKFHKDGVSFFKICDLFVLGFGFSYKTNTRKFHHNIFCIRLYSLLYCELLDTKK